MEWMSFENGGREGGGERFFAVSEKRGFGFKTYRRWEMYV
jgi:hypothetical protein